MSATDSGPGGRRARRTADAARSVADDAFGAGPGLAGLLGTRRPPRAWDGCSSLSSLLLLVVGRVAGALVDAERLDTSSISILDEYARPGLQLPPARRPLPLPRAGLPRRRHRHRPAAARRRHRRLPPGRGRGLLGVVLLRRRAPRQLLHRGRPRARHRGRRHRAAGRRPSAASSSALIARHGLRAHHRLALRPPGMTLDRVPVFTWSMLVAGVGVARLAAGARRPCCRSQLPRRPLRRRPRRLLASLGWAFGLPQVFAYALPAARRPARRRPGGAGHPARAAAAWCWWPSPPRRRPLLRRLPRRCRLRSRPSTRTPSTSAPPSP